MGCQGMGDILHKLFDQGTHVRPKLGLDVEDSYNL